MIMKKLIAIAVVFALVAVGVAFADLGAQVIGTVNLFEGSTVEDSDKTGSASFNRLRIEGSGENDDGTFGAWIRFSSEDGNIGHDLVAAYAWWKPIDQVKLTLGGNPDGIHGKEGYAGWMFYQMPSDIGIVSPHSVWGGPYLNPGWEGYAKYRNAFYEGEADYALFLDIKPVDMFGLNLILPYIGTEFGGSDAEKWGGSVGGVFKRMTIQADLNLDFGNIALTFKLNPYTKEADKQDGAIGGKVFLYFNLSAIDNLSLDLGIGFPLPRSYDGYKVQDPVAIGLAAKFDVSDTFGFKARLLAQFMDAKTSDSGDPDKGPFVLGLDLLPYIGINDSMKAFIGLGLTMYSFPEVGGVKPDSAIGWHFNPYLQVGAEWGPTFYAGIRVYTYGDKKSEKSVFGYDGTDVSAPIHFEIPIGIQVSF
jgi:hypothetical protein